MSGQLNIKSVVFPTCISCYSCTQRIATGYWIQLLLIESFMQNFLYLKKEKEKLGTVSSIQSRKRTRSPGHNNSRQEVESGQALNSGQELDGG